MDTSYVNEVIKVKQTSIVTLQMAKEQLHVEEDFVDDDESILFMIEAATGAAEDYTGTDIALTENTLEFIRFNGTSIQITEAPFKEIISITTEIDGVVETIPVEDYEIMVRKIDFTILFENSIEADKLTIVFHTGYDMDEAPYQVQQAILVKITDLYDLERTSYTVGANYRNMLTFERLLASHTINRW